jgi:hypothetical protein
MQGMDWLQAAAFFVSLFIIIGALLAFSALLMREVRYRRHPELLKEHYAAIMGLPGAAAGAFVLVTLFRQAEGQIKINLWGLQLEGAAGPVLLWVVCFLAIALAIKMIWPIK